MFRWVSWFVWISCSACRRPDLSVSVASLSGEGMGCETLRSLMILDFAR